MARSGATLALAFSAAAAALAWTTAAAPVSSDGIDPLAVVSVSPPPRITDALVGSSIEVRFDRPVDRATVSAESFWAFARWSGAVAGTIGFADDDRTIVLDPAGAFSAGEQVTVYLSHDLRGTDGASMRPGGYSFQFWTRARPAAMQFATVDVLDTNAGALESSRPYGGVASDMDGDGWLDITVVNEDTADLRVYLNSGDGLGTYGTFLQPTTPVNIQASPSEPSDFNRDGHVDLCVANIATSSVSILLGNGDGTFAPQQEIIVGAQPRGIAVLDVDGDGDVDIVNTNNSGNNLSVLINDGTGSFAMPTFFEGGGNGERALAAADMNEDGLLDLVVSMYAGQEVVVLGGNGDGTFTPLHAQASGGSMWMLVLGDVNGDGHEDVAGVSVSPASMGVILAGTGAGQLGEPDPTATDAFPLSTDLGDLDGDGDLDWVTSCFGGDWVVFSNDGNGGFAFAGELPAPSNASCAVPFDMDNDGDLDLALIDEIDDSIQIVINSGHARPGDVTGDGVVNVTDLLRVLAAWGPCSHCPEDLDGDDAVTVADLLLVLVNWG